jgi:hypothetical protein
VAISLCIGLLVTFGILWPLAMRFLSPDLTTSAPFMLGPLILISAFAFYFGGMAAAYTASSARTLHGVLVPFAAFAISPVINVISGDGLFPGVDRSWEVVLIAVFLAISIAAALVGARRGESIYHRNQNRSARGRSSRISSPKVQR